MTEPPLVFWVLRAEGNIWGGHEVITSMGRQTPVIEAQYSIIQHNNILKWTFKNSTHLAAPCLFTVWLALFGKMEGLESELSACHGFMIM